MGTGAGSGRVELCGHGVSRQRSAVVGPGGGVAGEDQALPGLDQVGVGTDHAAVGAVEVRSTSAATSGAEARGRQACCGRSPEAVARVHATTRGAGAASTGAGRVGRAPAAEAWRRRGPAGTAPGPQGQPGPASRGDARPRAAHPGGWSRPASTLDRGGDADGQRSRRAGGATRPSRAAASNAAAGASDRWPRASPRRQCPTGPAGSPDRVVRAKMSRPNPSFACVCIRQRSESSGVKRLSTDRLPARTGHGQGA